MKKVLCVFMAIVFVCCVMVHGKDERFSLEKMITNLTKFEDMPSFQDIVDCWQNDSYYVGNVQMLPYWIDIYSPLVPIQPAGIANEVLDYGVLPLALKSDGSVAEHSEYDISYMYLYTSDLKGYIEPLYIEFDDGTVSDTNLYPVIREYQKDYVEFTGDDSTFSDIKVFFSTVKSFFIRLWDCLGLIFRMVSSVFGNLKYLLPWNNTIPKEV